MPMSRDRLASDISHGSALRRPRPSSPVLNSYEPSTHDYHTIPSTSTPSLARSLLASWLSRLSSRARARRRVAGAGRSCCGVD